MWNVVSIVRLLIFPVIFLKYVLHGIKIDLMTTKVIEWIFYRFIKEKVLSKLKARKFDNKWTLHK